MFENVDDDDFSSFYYNFFYHDFYHDFHHDFHYDFRYNFHYDFQHDDDIFVSFENSSEESFKKYEFEKLSEKYKSERQFN